MAPVCAETPINLPRVHLVRRIQPYAAIPKPHHTHPKSVPTPSGHCPRKPTAKGAAPCAAVLLPPHRMRYPPQQRTPVPKPQLQGYNAPTPPPCMQPTHPGPLLLPCLTVEPTPAAHHHRQALSLRPCLQRPQLCSRTAVPYTARLQLTCPHPPRAELQPAATLRPCLHQPAAQLLCHTLPYTRHALHTHPRITLPPLGPALLALPALPSAVQLNFCAVHFSTTLPSSAPYPSEQRTTPHGPCQHRPAAQLLCRTRFTPRPRPAPTRAAHPWAKPAPAVLYTP